MVKSVGFVYYVGLCCDVFWRDAGTGGAEG